MPPIIRVLTGLVLALPGYLFCTAGFVASIMSAFTFALEPGSVWPMGLLFMTGSTLTGIIGFLMVASSDLLTGARHYRLPRHRIAVVIGYEIAVLALYTLIAGTLIGTMAASTRPNIPWGWLLLSLGSLSGLVATLRSKKLNLREWKRENEGSVPAESGDRSD